MIVLSFFMGVVIDDEKMGVNKTQDIIVYNLIYK